jgi:hypothetical protein
MHLPNTYSHLYLLPVGNKSALGFQRGFDPLAAGGNSDLFSTDDGVGGNRFGDAFEFVGWIFTHLYEV